MTEHKRPSEVVGRRVKDVRQRRAWSARRLAEECAAIGAKITDNVIENIEGRRRRDITVDELLVFARVLGVSPVDLLVPGGDEDAEYAVSPAVTSTAGRVRAWIAGEFPLPDMDPLLFRVERPRRPWKPTDEERVAYLREIYDFPVGEDRLPMWIELTDRHIEDATSGEEADDGRR